MKEFFKYMFASALGQLLTGIILVFLFAVFLVSSLFSGLKDFEGMNEKKVEIKDNSILHLTLNSPISDQQRNPDFNFDFSGFSSETKVGLNKLKAELKRAAKDEKIKGILLEVSMIPSGMATLEELRLALKEFKKSGKFIVAYSEIYSHKAYYLASVADEINLYPQGMVQHTGLTSEIMFMKGLIDKLELDVTIIRGSNNKFKSAVEPLMYEKMSDANREQTTKYLTALWNQMLKGISEERKINIEELNLLADSLKVDNADKAKQYKLVDNVVYWDEVVSSLKKRVGIKESDELNLVSYSDYRNDSRIKKEPKIPGMKKKDSGKDKIAVIYAIGDIVDGKGDKESIGSITLAGQIRDARLDSTVKAVVMRVNSPGGSALASDVIWREVVLTKKSKPFIVSMGDVAASGGYYISCEADKIYAQPNTITGSIGVFGVLPNMERMLKSKTGITYDRVKTNPYSDLGSITRKMDDFEFKTIQKGVDDIYNDFITKVSKGRKKLSVSDVDSIGQGRVWAGTDALAIGLVDELGGLDEAIKEAEKRAKLKEGDYELKEIPEIKNPFEEFLEQLQGDVAADAAAAKLGFSKEVWTYLEKTKAMMSSKSIQAKLPYFFTIE